MNPGIATSIAHLDPLAMLARRCRRLVLCVACALPCALPAWAQDAAALKAQHAALREAWAANPSQRPLALESSEPADSLHGEIRARIDMPFAALGAAVQGSAHWCEILFLHLNVQQCRATQAPAAAPAPAPAIAIAIATPTESLVLDIGRRFDQAPADAYRFEFAYRTVAARPDYLHVLLEADEGPFGTSKYRISLEALPLDAGRSFVHLSYSYAYGLAGRLAMQTYLATLGRGKLGFTVARRNADGQPEYLSGARGVVERNAMRYYLAIEAYLGALQSPPAAQFEKRLADWYAGIERYPRQLHDLERAEYLALKREQLRRQQAAGG
jgi:hypothetical protein